MERKKMVRLAIFVLIIIGGLIIVENSIRGIGNLVENKKENDRLEEEKKLYENSVQYKEKVMLEGVIENFVKLLNNNNIDAIYEMIDLNYRDYKFQNDKELFAEYIKTYVNNESKIILQTYEKINGKYVCRLLSEYKGELKSFVALIETQEDGSYNVIFDNITGIEKMSESYSGTGDLEYELLYKVTAQNVCIYTIEFSNSTKKSINYSYDSIKLRDTYGNEFSINTSDLRNTLEAGEKVRQDFIFNDSRIHKFPKTYLDINVKDEHGNLKVISIYLGTSI